MLFPIKLLLSLFIEVYATQSYTCTSYKDARESLFDIGIFQGDTIQPKDEYIDIATIVTNMDIPTVNQKVSVQLHNLLESILQSSEEGEKLRFLLLTNRTSADYVFKVFSF